MSFKTQVEALVTVPATFTEDMLGDSLSNGAKDVIQKIMVSRPEDIWLFTKSSAVEPSGLTVNSGFVYDVSRGAKSCTPIPGPMRHKAADSSSLAYATSEFPVYYHLDSKLFILPEPGAGSSKTISTFATDSNGTLITTSTDHGFNESDNIIIANSGDETYYIGAHYIHSVPSSTTFVITLAYSAGAGQTDYTVSEPTALCQHLSLPTVTQSASSIANFPAIYYTPVVLYGAMDVVLHSMAKIHTESPTLDIPAGPVAPILKEITTTLPTYTEPEPFIMPVPPTSVGVDFGGLSDLPTYELIDVPVAPALVLPVSQISMTSLETVDLPVPPPAPEIDSGEANFTQPRLDAPVYIKPVFTPPTFPILDEIVLPSAPVVPELEFNEDGQTNQAGSNLADYLPPVLNAPEWTSVDVAIIDEDPEMVSSKLQKIQSQVSVFQSELQSQLNIYQRDFAIYENKMKEAMQNSQAGVSIENNNNQSLLAKYGQELQKYQAESTTILQKWDKDNIQKKYTEWNTKYSNLLQEYQQNIAVSLNEFQAESAIYNAEIQKAMQDATNKMNSSNSEFSAKLNKYSGEVQAYQAKTAHQVTEWNASVAQVAMTEFTQKRADAMTEWNTSLTSTYSLYGQRVAERNNKFQAELSKYSADINKRMQEYQAETGLDMSIYTNQMNLATAKFQADMNQQDTLFKNQIQKFVTESQDVRSENQEIMSKYTAAAQQWQGEAGVLTNEYNAKLQDLGQQYNWYVAKLESLRAKYNESFMLSPQAQQQQKQ
tara:strand:- start:5838 stop:8147 length:2310 start_codon:yes stop_codon:yes gene_type:complete